MTKYCIGCRLHHDAGHQKTLANLQQYNDWCCKFGKTAKKAVSHCKLNNGKELYEVRKNLQTNS